MRWQKIWFSILGDFVGFGTSEEEVSCICNFLNFFYWIWSFKWKKIDWCNFSTSEENLKICNFYEFFFFKLDYRYCCWLLDDFEKFGMEFKNIVYLYIYILKTILLRNRMKFEIPIAVSSQWFNSNNDYCDSSCDILAEGRKF